MRLSSYYPSHGLNRETLVSFLASSCSTSSNDSWAPEQTVKLTRVTQAWALRAVPPSPAARNQPEKVDLLCCSRLFLKAPRPPDSRMARTQRHSPAALIQTSFGRSKGALLTIAQKFPPNAPPERSRRQTFVCPLTYISGRRTSTECGSLYLGFWQWYFHSMSIHATSLSKYAGSTRKPSYGEDKFGTTPYTQFSTPDFLPLTETHTPNAAAQHTPPPSPLYSGRTCATLGPQPPFATWPTNLAKPRHRFDIIRILPHHHSLEPRPLHDALEVTSSTS